MASALRSAALAVLCLLPASRVKNRLLSLFPGWSIHRTARVRPILVFNVREIRVDEGAAIGIACFIRNIDRVELESFAQIGVGNSFNAGLELTRYVSRPKSYLKLEPHSIITWRHYIDCSGGFCLGRFSMLAGRQSVILTHGVDVVACVNRIARVRVGSHCFIGTNCRIVAGVSIADRIVVGAASVVTCDLTETESLYGGSPAKWRKSLTGAAYFSRASGHVLPEGY